MTVAAKNNDRWTDPNTFVGVNDDGTVSPATPMSEGAFKKAHPKLTEEHGVTMKPLAPKK